MTSDFCRFSTAAQRLSGSPCCFTVRMSSEIWLGQCLSMHSEHVLPCLHVFPLGTLASSHNKKTCKWGSSVSLNCHRCKCEHKWLLVPICKPCDELASCQGCTPPLDECLLGSAPSSWIRSATLKKRGWIHMQSLILHHIVFLTIDITLCQKSTIILTLITFIKAIKLENTQGGEYFFYTHCK